MRSRKGQRLPRPGRRRPAPAAEAAAIEEFKIGEDQLRRLIVQEQE
jgi:hypothetical protein